MQTVMQKVGRTVAMMNNFDEIHFCDYIHKKKMFIEVWNILLVTAISKIGAIQ